MVQLFEDKIPNSKPERLVVGRVSGVWGLVGHLRVQVITNNVSRFSVGNHFYIENNNYECLDSWYSKSSLIIKFSDVYERSKAMDLVGKLIEINISDAPLLPDGEYYHHEIVGVEVWTNTGLYVGSISEILDTGSNDVYVVESETGELLIPAIPDVIESFNVDTGKAVISPIKGLL